MTCGIYKLIFNGTNKVYIGQSINIERRYKDHIRNTTKSKKMEEAFKYYGIPSVEILEECDIDKLDEREIYYVDKYDSFINGFNSTTGGNQPDSRDYNRKYDDEVYIDILVKLCDVNNSIMDIAAECNVHDKIVKNIYKGHRHIWLNEQFPELYKTAISIKRANGQKPGKHAGIILLGPDGFEYDAGDYMYICEAFELDYAGLSKVLLGQRNHHKGFRLKEPLVEKQVSVVYKEYKVVSPEGKEYIIPPRCKASFCREHGLRVESLTKMLNGITKQYKGWTLPK